MVEASEGGYFKGATQDVENLGPIGLRTIENEMEQNTEHEMGAVFIWGGCRDYAM